MTYRLSSAMRHNDAGGWGVIANDVLKKKKSDRISKFMNCHLLQNSFLCPTTAHLCR